jgi:hypothetical protein
MLATMLADLDRLLHMALDLADRGVIGGAILSTESGPFQGVSG